MSIDRVRYPRPRRQIGHETSKGIHRYPGRPAHCLVGGMLPGNGNAVLELRLDLKSPTRSGSR